MRKRRPSWKLVHMFLQLGHKMLPRLPKAGTYKRTHIASRHVALHQKRLHEREHNSRDPRTSEASSRSHLCINIRLQIPDQIFFTPALHV